ncbi:hypothetical protein HRbin36_01447 [bacterium HR36]|uniref:Uncharacterized protein n=1 Tax=uncultured Planctomycetota bacterium TaxID=120965 RepID=H5SLZ0_9BACT|nr:hypothetical protein HGMM_F48A06C19 [uncultured Planctomycetota bacterium]GBD36326.1 hypothetical protein HRbin36_01447 [bacterium HR36]
MTFRDRQLLRLRELLEQIAQLQEQLAWCQDETANEYLADCMLRDLEQCRRIVLSLKSPSQALLAN